MKAAISRLILCLLLVVVASAFCFAQTYTVTDLGAVPGMDYSAGRAINSSAQTTGASGKNGSDIAHVFVNTAGSFEDLGTLGGLSAIGNGINVAGQVAGYSENSQGTYRAFVSQAQSLVDIGDLGGGSAVAYAINDAGDVVGSAVTKSGGNHPFLYSNGKMTDLGTLGSPDGNSWWNSAQGINNAGVIAGTSYDAQGNFFGFLWSNGKMTKMRTLGGPWSQAYAINNAGQVTGIAYKKNGDAHAFITKANGKLKDLGVIDGKFSTVWGFGINDAGVVVGQSTFQDFYHAFVYNGKIKDLNKLIPKNLGWVLYEARGINNAGQIICNGMNSAGVQHAFLLTPQ
jgi:probable HAF family extracellular repeat protein